MEKNKSYVYDSKYKFCELMQKIVAALLKDSVWEFILTFACVITGEMKNILLCLIISVIFRQTLNLL